MNQSTINMTDIIVWVSPLVFGFIVWLAHELYKGLKEDVKNIKTSNEEIKITITEHTVKMDNLDKKISSVSTSVEKLNTMTHNIDKRQGGNSNVEQTLNQIDTRLNESDKNYGTILVILNGLAKRIGIDVKKG